MLSPVARATRAAAVLGLPVLAYSLSGALLSASGWSLCAFRHFTGLPCPLCGGTHAVYHLLRLDVASALEANAAVSLMALALALLGLRLAIEAVAGRALPVFHIPKPWRPRMAGLLVAFLALTWMVALGRTLQGAV